MVNMMVGGVMITKESNALPCTLEASNKA
jgi:hypothetical protein